MLNLIKSLARNIDARWREDDYSCYTFADIAKSELDKVDLTSLFSFTGLIDVLDNSEMSKIQIVSEFSELHLKLFDNSRFYIEVLNWWDNDTSIHDHGFSGVLLQLEGSSLNAIYAFDEIDEVSHNLSLGDIKLTEAYISKKGDCRVIPYGRKEKHAVLHLEKPTVSLIVRTHPVMELSPQLNYFPPGLRVNHSATDIMFNKKIKYFRLLNMIDSVQCRKQMLHELKQLSLTEQFWFILKLSKMIYHSENIELLNEYVNLANTEDEKKRKVKVVSAVTLRKTSQFFIDEIKPLFDNNEQRLILSCLAASYNQEDRIKMFHQLGVENSEDVIYSIIDNLPSHLKPRMLHALKLTGMIVKKYE
ncbi:hypothetical protein [Pectobacterium sp. A5351]|uniref:hypothetical protein n=1 Tax=Pectobacterium sp. A5351 TaxID=2914983 RepID=UPI00232AADA7|nr:hypothetical protein [Pectobacterium sp. A5351]WCG83914.1 hypothetical protein O1Q74_04280 [Pectobacterium sp. A5351]